MYLSFKHFSSVVFRNLSSQRLGLLHFTKSLNVKRVTGVQYLNDVHIIYMFMCRMLRPYTCLCSR